jgi:hypothetical protein
MASPPVRLALALAFNAFPSRLNVNQPFRHLRFSSQILPVCDIADCASWLPVAVIGRFSRTAGTISGRRSH